MIKTLDCTLRDGGYNNNWEFRNEDIQVIAHCLSESNVDIVEFGYLSQIKGKTENSTQFSEINQVSAFIPQDAHFKSAIMINYGEYSLEAIPNSKEGNVQGIRVAFHKKDYKEAIKYAETIQQKGYEVFLQPMITMSYTDEELLDMLRQSAQIVPYAIYIVDSFGIMSRKQVIELYRKYETYLPDTIAIGFHSHNNLQLSYANAQALCDIDTTRTIIVDSSIMGMGRGAGNLNTELFLDYLNDNCSSCYHSTPLLTVVDEILSPIYSKHTWGYSLPYYLSAIYNIHPNYATFFDDKGTLKLADFDALLRSIPTDRKILFDRAYAEDLYQSFKEKTIKDSTVRETIQRQIAGKKILIVAPGSSILKNKESIENTLRDSHVISFSVNFCYEPFPCDYVFVSNARRYEKLHNIHSPLILTSNIEGSSALVVDYASLLNNNEVVSDNAGLMLITLLISCGAQQILLAGFDGYTTDVYDNYYSKDIAFMKSNDAMYAKNEGFKQVINEFRKSVTISFITPSKYD